MQRRVSKCMSFYFKFSYVRLGLNIMDKLNFWYKSIGVYDTVILDVLNFKVSETI